MSTVKESQAARRAASCLVRALRFPDPVMEGLSAGPLRFELAHNWHLSDRLWVQIVSQVRDPDVLWDLVTSVTTPVRVRTMLEAVDETEFPSDDVTPVSRPALLARVLGHLPEQYLSEELVWAVSDRAPDSVCVGETLLNLVFASAARGTACFADSHTVCSGLLDRYGSGSGQLVADLACRDDLRLIPDEYVLSSVFQYGFHTVARLAFSRPHLVSRMVRVGNPDPVLNPEMCLYLAGMPVMTADFPDALRDAARRFLPKRMDLSAFMAELEQVLADNPAAQPGLTGMELADRLWVRFMGTVNLRNGHSAFAMAQILHLWAGESPVPQISAARLHTALVTALGEVHRLVRAGDTLYGGPWLTRSEALKLFEVVKAAWPAEEEAFGPGSAAYRMLEDLWKSDPTNPDRPGQRQDYLTWRQTRQSRTAKWREVAGQKTSRFHSVQSDRSFEAALMARSKASPDWWELFLGMMDGFHGTFGQLADLVDLLLASTSSRKAASF